MKLNILISAVTALLLAALSFNAHGQNLQGKVVDENDEPLAYANVMLQKADSAYLSGAMTDTLGMFTMPAHPDGKMLHVSFIGYESYHAPINGTDFGTIRMIPDTELLGKAVVKGYLPKTVIKGDAFVTPVENSVLAEAGPANEGVEKLPGVISKDGEYEIIAFAWAWCKRYWISFARSISEEGIMTIPAFKHAKYMTYESIKRGMMTKT